MACDKTRFLRAIGTSVGFLLVSSTVLAQTFIGPTPYLSKNDSPFITSINAGTTFLETFESGALATPGVTASAGSAIGPGGLTDSVDADDGTIDGSGTNGHSFFSGGGSTGITFTFDATVLGSLPTQVGIVWTDGAGTTLFEAFGPGGVPLGQIGPVAIADGSFVGETAEDRFFAVTNPGGISAIRISNTSGGIEVDHLQYGVFGAAPPASADLAVTKTSSATATAGSNISYTVVVTNNGPDTAAGVSLADTIPAGTTFISLSTPAGWTATTPAVGGTGTVTATNPSLASGATATFVLVVNVNSGTATGTTLTNTAVASSSTADANSSNNAAIATTTITAVVPPTSTNVPIPTLGEWALVVLALLLVGSAAIALRRRMR
jgi:uncharacterized repeat protein (TIGR01451 family)